MNHHWDNKSHFDLILPPGPEHISADDTVVRGKVTATYTYGKPVNGQVVLKFAVDNKSQKMYSGAYQFKEVTTELVDGEADWEVVLLFIAESIFQVLTIQIARIGTTTESCFKGLDLN